ncbi:MAG TPA: hypothetical protein PKD54_14925, partial [Pirellulaceae bacterium]|nr:hypothetical protein [Pirellulaceae bacterium]
MFNAAVSARYYVVCAVWAAWAGLLASSVNGQLRPKSEDLLPSTTKAWVSIPDAVAFVDQFNGTGLRQLFMSPPMHAAVENLRTQV